MPGGHIERINAAAAARDQADEAYRTAVADALKVVASVREMSRLTGLSTSTLAELATPRPSPSDATRGAARLTTVARSALGDSAPLRLLDPSELQLRGRANTLIDRGSRSPTGVSRPQRSGRHNS